MNSTQTFFVVGCLPFLDDLVGFALPILKTPARPHTEVVQYIDEYTGLISGFFEFERTSEQIVLQQNDFTVKGGDEHVLAFVTEDGFCHLGTATSLAPILRGFISRFPKRNAIALQVAELIGNAQEKNLLVSQCVKSSSTQPGCRLQGHFTREPLLGRQFGVIWSH
ncbi:hypothetical protein NKH80_24615 [Mesorhizobium sp. M0904]|uniref:hypothetical protein n=1 Tax=Mesorhizobium sp. M0904 TaxID=2957022 RepID=UPI00333A1B2B